MSSQDPGSGTVTAAPSTAVAASAASSSGGFFSSVINEFKKLKSSVVHFFTSTKAGQAIEHVGLQITALPGFHAFVTKFEVAATQIVHDLIVAASASPGGKSVNDVLAEAGGLIANTAKGALNDFSAGWEHALAAIALQNVSTIPGVADLLKLLAPSQPQLGSGTSS